MPVSVLHPVRPIFRAVASTVVPEAAQLDAAGWSELENVVEVALAARPEKMRGQLVTFIRLIDLLSVARYGRRFTRLNAPRRATFLRSLERSRAVLVRRGFWGLRTLIFSGYYTRPEIVRAIGYRAHRLGWAARGGTASAVPMSPTEVWVEPA
jgi:hypothetical protein